MMFYDELSDKKLAEYMKAGDADAFTGIYNRYHSLLYIYAQKKLLDKQESEDVVQEVLTTLWLKRSELVLHSSLASYLYTSVRNRAFDLFAHRKIEARYLVSLEAFMKQNEGLLPDAVIHEKDIRRLIEKEIQSLPPRMREIFELSRKESLSHREIAELLNLSEHTVATQIKRALRVLRLRLGVFAWLYVVFFY